MGYFCKKNKLGRLLALDYGKRRTGIAITDETAIDRFRTYHCGYR